MAKSDVYGCNCGSNIDDFAWSPQRQEKEPEVPSDEWIDAALNDASMYEQNDLAHKLFAWIRERRKTEVAHLCLDDEYAKLKEQYERMEIAFEWRYREEQRLRAELEQARGKWVPVDERKPRMDTRVLGMWLLDGDKLCLTEWTKYFYLEDFGAGHLWQCWEDTEWVPKRPPDYWLDWQPPALPESEDVE